MIMSLRRMSATGPRNSRQFRPIDFLKTQAAVVSSDEMWLR